jgi:hypothetical protein
MKAIAIVTRIQNSTRKRQNKLRLLPEPHAQTPALMLMLMRISFWSKEGISQHNHALLRHQKCFALALPTRVLERNAGSCGTAFQPSGRQQEQRATSSNFSRLLV